MERTAVRLWKRLPAPDRLAAATAFWKEPPQEVLGAAVAAIVKARHLRPQVARSLPPEARAQALAAILDPGETLAASLLVALHLSERRPLLATFLDAVGLPHENGLLKDEAASPPPLSLEAVKKAVHALAQAFPREQVLTYLNTLFLQDPERWSGLEKSEEWL